MKKGGIKLIALVFVAACGLVAASVAYRWYADNRKPNFGAESAICVYPGSTASEVFNMILDTARVKSARSLSRAFADKKVAENLKPGRYVIKPSYTSVYVARMLNNGWQTPTRLVLSGTLRQKGQIALRISRQMMVDSASVHEALCDAELLARYGFTPSDVFSMFIPDTYEMYWTASVEDILERQKEAYDAFWTEENIAKARAQGLTKKEASVLASIVKGETNYEPEMPCIAGVYLNRLHKGMRLQADPTVAYLLNYKVNRILRSHLEIESPYNTYLHEGLPPGPICVPTKACLNAVLNPDKHGYIYFCANANFNGSHKFAVTYNEHLENAREFQAALNKRNAGK